MARQRIIQNAFSTGVVSPRVLGRTDQDKFKHGAEALQNVIVLPQGALKRRPGSQWVADAMGPSRLIPFEFSPGQAYIIELGNQTARIYYASNTDPITGADLLWTTGFPILVNGAPLTLTTPYDTSVTDLFTIQFAQQGDTMYLFAGNYPVQKLERFGQRGIVSGPNDTSWRWLSLTFDCPPTDSFDEDITGGTLVLTPGTAAQPDGSTGDATVAGALNVPFVTTAGTFLEGDVGKYIVVDTQIAKITSTTKPAPNNVGNIPYDSSGATAYCTILGPFFSATNVITNWLLRGNPGVWGSAGSTVAASPDPETHNPEWLATAQYGIGQTENFETFHTFPLNGKDSSAQARADCFRTTDVGRYISYSGCMAQIIEFVNAHRVSVRWSSVPEDTFVGTVAGEIRVSPAGPGAWSIEDPIWGAVAGTNGRVASGVNGYPSVGAFFQGRLYLGSTTLQPKTFWASQAQNFENFAKGHNAGDGLEFTIGGGRLDEIVWLQAGAGNNGDLLIETSATEYAASGAGGGGGPLGGTPTGSGITPTNIEVNTQSSYGGCSIPPVLIDTCSLYVQRYHTKLLESKFSFSVYARLSRDISLWAEHLTRAGIKDMCLQVSPYKLIWMVTMDGRLLSLTYDVAQTVEAWAEHRTGYADGNYGKIGTGDSYISCACIPNPAPELASAIDTGLLHFPPEASATFSADLVWTVVKRLRNNQTVYTVELFNENLLVDCSQQVPKTSATKLTTVTDANLAGRVVTLTGLPWYSTVNFFPFDSPLLDDVVTPVIADSTGKVTIPNSGAKSITSYGLPIRPMILTMRPEMLQAGTIQGVLQQWSDYYVRVFSTLGLYINGYQADDADSWETYKLAGAPDGIEPPVLALGQNLDGSYVGAQQALSDELAAVTRDIRCHPGSFDRNGRVIIYQKQPFPLTILCTFGILNWGDL